MAFPNPFQSKATIRFTLPGDSPYTFTLFDRIGQVVDQRQGIARAGKQNTLEVAGEGLSSGLYFVRLQLGNTAKVLRLLLAR
jgi:hypothetical protein